MGTGSHRRIFLVVWMDCSKSKLPAASIQLFSVPFKSMRYDVISRLFDSIVCFSLVFVFVDNLNE